MRVARYALAAATVVVMTGLTVTPALAQVDVRVKVDTKVVRDMAQDVAREVRTALHAALGPDLRRSLEDAARDLADAFEEFGHLPWESGDRVQSQRYRATLTDRETRRFNIGAAGQVDLETLSGDVTIKRGSGRELVVEIVRDARGTTDATAKAGLAAVRAVSEERGGRVTIKAVYAAQRGRDYSVNVSYIVSAPADTRISTRSMSGDISADGINGELTLSTTSGDVTASNAARLMSATTASGDITLTNVGAEGLLEASTLSGDILATGVKARRISLGTIAGNVTARGVEAGDAKLTSVSDDVVFEGTLSPRGRYEFISQSGDVRITVDGGVGFSLEASSFSGGVRSDLALQGSRASTNTGRRGGTNRSLNGTFGDGSAVISATSFSGSVIVAKK